ncbi:hypothetical protein [Pseudoroseicyclus tamaricis]|uniref:Uncharacterized protein n=1 Tax=Pseudoroseicyclus tamaricis TaxID=2705421 RepID=A0A6B2JWR3_9RHOB|nr:hypothetical protein [Pseudoroseicyclus tamaricis]NDV02658.1 hypothetical protein [Pseudoroseicyclus tamaricis]
MRQMPTPASRPAAVSWLDMREIARLDPEPLQRLQAGLGPQLAADLLRRTREDLAFLLASAQQAYDRSDTGTLARFGRRIEVLALQVGMPTLRRAAANMAASAEGGSPPALAATAARLDRLGQGAVASLGALRITGA